MVPFLNLWSSTGICARPLLLVVVISDLPNVIQSDAYLFADVKTYSERYKQII